MNAVILGLFLILQLVSDSSCQWTLSATGCECNYDRTLLSCACCNDGGCQCPLLSETSSQMCVQCGQEDTCPSDLPADCIFVNGDGCFIAHDTDDKLVFGEAGLYCTMQDAHLPNIKNSRIWEDIRDYATPLQWGGVWTGGRIRDFDWQWSISGNHVLRQGCYADMPLEPNLSFLLEIHENVTAESCIQQCADMNYTYAAVQFETVAIVGTSATILPCCRCDNETGLTSDGEPYSVVPLIDCNLACVSAEPSAFSCGAHNTHLLFRIGGTQYDAWSYTDINQGQCGMLDANSKDWIPFNCSRPLNHICEYPGLSSSDCTARINRMWVAGKCISTHTDEHRTWHQATRHCGQLDAFLVQIEDGAFNEALATRVSSTDQLWWIGLTDRQLTWTDGSAVTTMEWASGQPDYREHDFCVELNRGRDYRGKMDKCSDDSHVICQLVYNWTDMHYQDYISYYAVIDDTYSSDGGGGGGNNNNNPPPTTTTEDDGGSNRNNSGSGSDEALYIGIGVGVAVVLLIILVFVVIIIKQRKHIQKKEKLHRNSESNVGFSGPGLDRGESYKLSRQDTLYEKIDDTYERPEDAAGTGVPTSYAGLYNPGYMELQNDPEARHKKASYRKLPDPNAPELPPRPENGYAGLTPSEDYSLPSPYTGLNTEEAAYAGLNSKHVEGVTTDSSDSATGTVLSTDYSYATANGSVNMVHNVNTDIANGGANTDIANGGANTAIANGGANTAIANGGANTAIANGGANTAIANGGPNTAIANGGANTELHNLELQTDPVYLEVVASV